MSACRGSAVGRFRKGEEPCVAVVRRTEAKVTPTEVVEIAGVRAGGHWFLSGLQALLGLH